MKLSFLKVLICTIGLGSMFGCREYHLYKYDPVSLKLLDGELTVNLEGTYGENYTNNVVKLADFGAPYTLQFMLSMPYEHELYKLMITNVVLTGEESGRVSSLENTESVRVKDPRIRNPDAQARTIIASIGNLGPERFKYENYVLSANVAVYSNSSSFKEKTITAFLKKNYQKDNRSDWLDKNIGI